MIRLSALLLALALLGCPEERAPAPPPKQDALAERVAAVARKTYPEAKVEVVANDAVLVKVGETETTIGLDNLRLTCANEPACGEAITTAVKNVRALAPEKDEGKFDQKKILLTLKTTDFLEGVDKMMKEKVPEKYASNRIPRTPFLGDLVIVYVLDAPTGMRLLSQQDLDANGLTLEQLDALAKENLSAAFPELTPMEDISNGVFTNSKDENYASALVVLPALWAPLAKQVKSPLIVAAPARNRVFAVSGKDKVVLAAFKKVVGAAVTQEDHPLSAVLLEWTPKGFRAWKN